MLYDVKDYHDPYGKLKGHLCTDDELKISKHTIPQQFIIKKDPESLFSLTNKLSQSFPR